MKTAADLEGAAAPDMARTQCARAHLHVDADASPPATISLSDGRLLVDALPERIAVLPGEVSLVESYLADVLATLLG